MHDTGSRVRLRFSPLSDSVAIESRNAAIDCFRFITLKQNVRVRPKHITDFFIFVEINFDDSFNTRLRGFPDVQRQYQLMRVGIMLNVNTQFVRVDPILMGL